MKRIGCPMLHLWTDGGPFDAFYVEYSRLLHIWRQSAPHVNRQAMRGGHFFAEENPNDTAFLLGVRRIPGERWSYVTYLTVLNLTDMMATTVQLKDNLSGAVNQPNALTGLALMRLTIGAMFVWVFFENLRKGLYTATGYANLIHDYIENGSAPAAWKSVMAFAAAHASMAAPLQAVTEISLGVLLVLGLFTRPVALVAFGYLASLWISEWGAGWIWELLVPVMVSLALAVGAAGRTWGLDGFLSRKRPSSLWCRESEVN